MKQAEAGEFISAEDYPSTLANFSNGYVGYLVMSYRASITNQLEQNNVKDPLTRAREEVQFQRDRVMEVGNCLRTLLGLPEGRLEFPLKDLSQQ